MQLHCEQWKPKNQTPQTTLVFLHGLGGIGKIWRPLAAQLEEQFQILAPDQRGHGKSRINASEPVHPLDFGKDLIETLTAQHAHPVWVIGHSMGVRSACAFAHLKPDWTAGVVLVDLGFDGGVGASLGPKLDRFLKSLPPSFHSRSEAKEFLTSHCPDPSMAQYLLAVAETNPQNKTLSLPFDPSTLVRINEVPTSAFHLREQIEGILEKGIPVLTLRGEKSEVWKRENYLQEKEYFKNSKLQFEEVAGAGHGLPFEKRKEFIQILVDFVTP